MDSDSIYTFDSMSRLASESSGASLASLHFWAPSPSTNEVCAASATDVPANFATLPEKVLVIIFQSFQNAHKLEADLMQAKSALRLTCRVFARILKPTGPFTFSCRALKSLQVVMFAKRAKLLMQLPDFAEQLTTITIPGHNLYNPNSLRVLSRDQIHESFFHTIKKYCESLRQDEYEVHCFLRHFQTHFLVSCTAQSFLALIILFSHVETLHLGDSSMILKPAMAYLMEFLPQTVQLQNRLSHLTTVSLGHPRSYVNIHEIRVALELTKLKKLCAINVTRGTEFGQSEIREYEPDWFPSKTLLPNGNTEAHAEGLVSYTGHNSIKSTCKDLILEQCWLDNNDFANLLAKCTNLDSLTVRWTSSARDRGDIDPISHHSVGRTLRKHAKNYKKIHIDMSAFRGVLGCFNLVGYGNLSELQCETLALSGGIRNSGDEEIFRSYLPSKVSKVYLFGALGFGSRRSHGPQIVVMMPRNATANQPGLEQDWYIPYSRQETPELSLLALPTYHLLRDQFMDDMNFEVGDAPAIWNLFENGGSD